MTPAPTPPSARARGWLRAGGNRDPKMLSVEFVDALCNDVIALEAEVAALNARPEHQAFVAHVMARLEQWDADPESPVALAEEWLTEASEALPRFVRPILRDLLDTFAEARAALDAERDRTIRLQEAVEDARARFEVISGGSDATDPSWFREEAWAAEEAMEAALAAFRAGAGSGDTET